MCIRDSLNGHLVVIVRRVADLKGKASAVLCAAELQVVGIDCYGDTFAFQSLIQIGNRSSLAGTKLHRNCPKMCIRDSGMPVL